MGMAGGLVQPLLSSAQNCRVPACYPLKRVRLWGRVSLISGPCSPHPWGEGQAGCPPPLYPWPLSPPDSGPLTFLKKDPEVELPAQAGQHSPVEQGADRAPSRGSPGWLSRMA